MVKKKRSFASRSSYSSRPGLEWAVSQADPPGSTADGPDDDAASVLSRSSSWGEWVRGNTKVSSKHPSHGTSGPKSPARRPTQCSIPPDPKPVIWLVRMGLGLYRKLSLAALTLLTDHPRGSGCIASYP